MHEVTNISFLLVSPDKELVSIFCFNSVLARQLVGLISVISGFGCFIVRKNKMLSSIISSERHEWLVSLENLVREVEIIKLYFLSSNDQKSRAHFLCVQQDEDSEYTLATDFEIGHFFRERIIPRAVLYFTGEALEDDESVWIFK